MKTVPLRNNHKHHIFNEVDSCGKKKNLYSQFIFHDAVIIAMPLDLGLYNTFQYPCIVIPFAKFKTAASTSHPRALIASTYRVSDGNDR